MASVVPRSMNLGALKPNTVPAYARRVESLSNNNQDYSEDIVARIPIDTSTPGAFLDPTQSLLQFDIAITNSNPYIDYINLSSSGLAAIIQEMRIVVQGTPVEEILDYNMMFELFMDLGGHCQEEFKLYMENSWRAPVPPGVSDLNFVKPPMVDREGIIMCPGPVNLFGDGNKFNIHNEDGLQLIPNVTATYSGTALSNAAYIPTNYPNYSNGGNYLTTVTNNNVTTGTNGYAGPSSIAHQRGPGSSITPGGVTVVNSDTGANLDPALGQSYCGNYIHTYHPYASTNTGSTAAGNVRAQTWTNRIDNTYVTWPSTIRPEPQILNEGRKRAEGDLKKYRVQDYLTFLANVKNIPVGVAPIVSTINDDASITGALCRSGEVAGVAQAGGETNIAKWNFTNIRNTIQTTSPHSIFQPTTFRYSVSLPIFSGLLGVWAEKQFPAMLIAPGALAIEIKFAKASQAFQCAMDPCRRLIGSYRDYVPNCGLPNYYATEFRGQALHPLQTKTITACDGTNNTWMAITTAGATGNDFAWKGILAAYPPLGAQAATTKLDLNGGNGNAYRNNLFGNSQDAAILRGGMSANGIYNDAAGMQQGFTTGNPKPQYVPRALPWIMAGNGFSDSACTATAGTGYGYVRERHVCFGTYLPFSTAQVRRTRSKYNGALGKGSGQGNNIPSNANYDAAPTYKVSSLRYVGIQTILPDEVTASIVRAAASSDISLYAQSVRTYKNLLQSSITQGLNINGTNISSANSLWVIFQNQNTIENTHYCSLTRTCPFASFQWTPDPYDKFVGSDTAPSVKAVSTTDAFNIQLKIGNETLPVQPITSIPQVLTELQRSIHGLADMNTHLPFNASVRTDYFLSNTSTNTFGDSTYNFMKNNDFCVPYIPIEALDDQTITNNPIFMDYHNATGTGYAQTYNAIGGTFFNDRGTYALPEFLPPVSKFLLGFDLDTFPGTNDTARSGRFLGNSVITLNMNNLYQAVIPSIKTSVQPDTIQVTCMIMYDIRWSIMAGGHVQAFF